MTAPLLGEDWQRQLMELNPDWDSYGACRIFMSAIATLEHFSVVPCHDGGIQLEIHRDGFDVEIEISPSGQIRSALVSAERLT